MSDLLALVDEDRNHIIAIGREFRFEDSVVFLSGKYLGDFKGYALAVRPLSRLTSEVYGEEESNPLTGGPST